MSLGVGSLTGCNLTPRKLAYDDPRVQELLRARDAAAARRLGFTAVLPTAEIRLEDSSGAYDRMLHVHGATSRTIAFRSRGQGFKWIGEQETFQGPRTYASADGLLREEIVMTYELEPISQHSTGTLIIRYFGEDQRLVHRDDLTLEAIVPVLREWGYVDVGVAAHSGLGTRRRAWNGAELADATAEIARTFLSRGESA